MPAEDLWQPPSGSTLQGAGRRGTAQLIDLVLFYVVLLVTQALVGAFGPIEVLLFSTVAFNYLVICEWLWGQTFGKRLMLIRVFADDGARPTYNSAVLRNIGLLVDFLPMFFLLGLICMSETLRRQRLGDRWAHTVVIGPPGPALGNPPGGYSPPNFPKAPPAK